MFRSRLPFLDVTDAVVPGSTGTLLIDTGSTLTEARAIAALKTPQHQIRDTVVDLGGRTVSITHPGRGHTRHDLIVSVSDRKRTVVFCGDRVDESGDPVIDEDSDVAAWPATLERLLETGGSEGVFVPGHGAVVDAAFVRRQQRSLLGYV